MLIIIEGVDRTGKSELARALAAKIQARGQTVDVWHAAAPKEHPLEVYEAALKDYDPRGTHSIIIDRWHVGERVWPEIFGRVSEFDVPMYKHVEAFLDSRGAVLVYAQRDDTVAQLREYQEHQEPLTAFTLTRALDLYREALWQRHADHIGYSHLNQEASVHSILTAAHSRQCSVNALHAFTSQWIGSPHARLLLVGERFGPAHGKRPAAAVPFVPFRNTSGHFLFSEIGLSPLWRDVAVVNAFREDGQPEDLQAIRIALGFPRICALGKTAAAEVHRQIPGNGIFDVPHPQYVRRFKRSWAVGTYHNMIRACVTDSVSYPLEYKGA